MTLLVKNKAIFLGSLAFMISSMIIIVKIKHAQD